MKIYNTYEKSDQEYLAIVESSESINEHIIKLKKERYSVGITFLVTLILIICLFIADWFLNDSSGLSTIIVLVILAAITYARKENLDSQIKSLLLYQKNILTRQ